MAVRLAIQPAYANGNAKSGNSILLPVGSPAIVSGRQCLKLKAVIFRSYVYFTHFIILAHSFDAELSQSNFFT